MSINAQFPKDRREAAKIADQVKQQALLMGCTCRNIQVDFIEPPVGKSYVRVGHDLLCPLSKS